MKISTELLKHYIPITQSPEELVPFLMRAGIEVEGIDGDVLELGITPNLGHCLSAIGIARELSLHMGLPLLTQPWESVALEGQPLRVELRDPALCPRYSCVVVEGVEAAHTPHAIKEQLEACGYKSNNALVDITNLVMLELGQPLHAFDLQEIEGRTIVVRQSQPGEQIDLLDETRRPIPPGAAVIADGMNRPLALGGVMGGKPSAVAPTTKAILIESAVFDSGTTRRTSKVLPLQTEGSRRFERGTDPNGTLRALRYVVWLIQQAMPHARVTAYGDVGTDVLPATISCRQARVSRVLGGEVSASTIESCFRGLGFAFQTDGGTYQVQVPPYRHDLQGEIDLIEEVAKYAGYPLTDAPPAYTGSQACNNALFSYERMVRRRMVAEGLQEFVTCSLISPEQAAIVRGHPIQADSVVSVMNPLSVEQSVLRPSLLPGLLQVVQRNVNQRNLSIHGFEVGNIHLKDAKAYTARVSKIGEPSARDGASALLGGRQFGSNNTGGRPSSGCPVTSSHSPTFETLSVYQEQLVLGIVLSADGTDFFDLKGHVENFLDGLLLRNYQIALSNLSLFHGGRQARVMAGDVQIGMLGEIHPTLQRQLDIPQRVLFAEFDLQEIMKLPQGAQPLQPLPLYPASERDWTVTLPEAVAYAAIERAIRQAASPLLESYSLVTIFRHERLGAGNKNVTLHFVYRDRTRTVAQEEVDAEHARIIAHTAHALQPGGTP